MGGAEKFHNVIKILTESFQVDDEAINELREILERQQQQIVTKQQAEEVGRGLITIFETLANGKEIIIKGNSNDK
ncbi:MAG TPA: hypothetical protein PLO25_00695 [Candidatus Saccharibacteria bacterium]|nr:hypothetical protein [Candidatus Saccharibacteria bacterium]